MTALTPGFGSWMVWKCGPEEGAALPGLALLVEMCICVDRCIQALVQPC